MTAPRIKIQDLKDDMKETPARLARYKIISDVYMGEFKIARKSTSNAVHRSKVVKLMKSSQRRYLKWKRRAQTPSKIQKLTILGPR